MVVTFTDSEPSNCVVLSIFPVRPSANGLVAKDGTLAASVLGIIVVATSAVAVGRLSSDGLFSGMIEAVTASGALGDGRLRSPPPSSTTEISGSSSNVTVMELLSSGMQLMGCTI